MQKLDEITSQAEAGAAELEPEMLEKCGQFMEELKAVSAGVGGYHKERYGGGEPEGSEAGTEEGANAEGGKPEAAPEEEDEAAKMVKKSLDQDLFYGRRIQVPQCGLDLLTAVESSVNDQGREFLDMFTKSCVPVVYPELQSKEVEKATETPEQENPVEDFMSLVRGAFRK